MAANAESSLIVGIPVKRMLMLGWALAAGIGAIAGAIIAQYRNVLDFNFMAAVLLFGFAAACVGGFDSIKGAVVGGLLVGHRRDVRPGAVHVRRQRAVAGRWCCSSSSSSCTFRPQGLFGIETGGTGMTGASRSSSSAGRSPTAALQLLGWLGRSLAVFLYVTGVWHRTSAPSAGPVGVTLAVAILGLNIVTGYSGQISVGHSCVLRHRRLHDDDPRRRPRLAVPGHVAGRRRRRLHRRLRASASRRCKIRGLYLALVTLGLALAFPAIVKSDNFFGVDFASLHGRQQRQDDHRRRRDLDRPVSAGSRRRGRPTAGRTNDWVFATVFVVMLVIVRG